MQFAILCQWQTQTMTVWLFILHQYGSMAGRGTRVVKGGHGAGLSDKKRKN